MFERSTRQGIEGGLQLIAAEILSPTILSELNPVNNCMGTVGSCLFHSWNCRWDHSHGYDRSLVKDLDAEGILIHRHCRVINLCSIKLWSFPGGSVVKNLPAMQQMLVHSLGREDLLEKRMITHSSILAWRTSWTEDSCGLQYMGVTKSWTWLND